MSRSITNETERVRRIWEKLAPNYDKGITFFEKLLFSGGRQWTCSQATGVVLEIGVGTGRNLEYYPQGIELTGIDLSPQMIAVAQDRARTLGRRANLGVGDAQALQVADESVDTVVSTLTLCSIPDDRRAIREVKRVLRGGGRFILMEHVASPIQLVRVFQQVLDWITVPIAADHQVREPLHHLEAEGFRIEAVERLKWGIVERAVARRPSVDRLPE
jgi:ubiquinone/menaquinone biosynthesis C-methylase UbiE